MARVAVSHYHLDINRIFLVYLFGVSWLFSKITYWLAGRSRLTTKKSSPDQELIRSFVINQRTFAFYPCHLL